MKTAITCSTPKREKLTRRQLLQTTCAITAACLLSASAGIEPAAADPSAPLDAGITLMVASDGDFENRVELTWDAELWSRAAIHITRDGTLLSIQAHSVRSYIDFTGDPGVTYEYCLTVVDEGAVVGDPVCAQGRRIIFAPENVRASDGLFDAHVEISWSDRSQIEAGYHVYRDGVQVAELPSNTNVFRDTETTPGETHQYCVNAFDSNGFASEAGCDSGRRGFVLPPLQVSASDGQFPDFTRIQWLDQSDGASRFRIFRAEKATPEAPVVLVTLDAATTSYDDASGNPGVIYTYCVVAVSDDDQESVQLCDDGGRGTLAPPANVNATAGTFDDRVRISWSNPEPTEDGFRIFRRDLAAPDSVQIHLASAGVLSFEDRDAEPGTLYRYCVVAFTGHGAQSEAVCAEGFRSHVLPPTNVSASDGTYEHMVELTWESQATAGVMFRISRNGELVATLPATARSYIDEILPSDTPFEYCVSANTSLGTASPQVCGSGFRSINPPANLLATVNQFENRVELNWTDNSHVEDGFRIYRRPESGGSFEEIGTREANRTSFIDSQGVPGIRYVYRVGAFDQYGESAYAEAVGSRELHPPGELTASQGTFEQKIELSWIDNSRAETGYDIFRAPEGGTAYAFVATTGANARSYTDTGVATGAGYDYRVVTVDAFGSSDPAETTGFTTILPPAALNASSQYDDRVVLTWVDQSAVETGYRIRRDGTQIHMTAANVTTFTDNGAVAGQLHTYCVETVSGTGASEAACTQGLRTKFEQTDGLLFGSPRSVEEFGSSVAVHGRYAIAGAPGYNNGRGRAIIFRREGSSWHQMTVLTRPPFGVESSTRFGTAVAIYGNYALVGAPLQHTGAGTLAGIVFVYRRTGETWQWVQTLAQDDPAGGNRFGTAIAMNDQYAVVGAPNSLGPNFRRGAADFFRLVNDSWDHIGRVDGQLSRDDFGYSVAIHESTVVIGRPSPERAGGVFLYQISGDIISDHTALFPSPPESGDHCGSSVAISEELLAMGCSVGNKAYVFERNGTSWGSAQALPSSGEGLFGTAAAIMENRVVIGASSANSAYVFEKDRADWEQVQHLQPPAGTPLPTDFGRRLVYDDDWLMAGAGLHDGGQGAVYLFPQLPPPADVVATNGTHEKRVEIRWKDRTDQEDGYRVYRDGRLIATLNPGVQQYYDLEAAPGGAYEYCVAAFSDDMGESPRVCDFGWRPTDGALTGRVATSMGAGVEDVEICLDPTPGNAMLFDGQGGFLNVMNGESGEFRLENTVTVEAWIRTSRLDGRHIIFSSRKNDPVGGFQLEVGTGDNGTNRVAVTGVNTWVAQTPNNAISSNEWTHIAYTRSGSGSGTHKIYVNGAEQALISDAAYEFTHNPAEKEIGRNFTGEIDELRVWNYARSAEQIQEAMHTPLSGREEGLAAYWSFDMRTDGAVMDRTENGRHGVAVGGVFATDTRAPLTVCVLTDVEGNYSMRDINYGTSTTFRVTPRADTRQFEPAYKTITLSTENAVQNEVAFTDVSSYTVAGTVAFEGTQCFEEKAEILVDGVVRGITESDGSFSVPVEAGPRVIEVRSGSFVYQDARRQIDVQGDIFDMQFLNITKEKVLLQVGGSCNTHIGTFGLEIFTENECFSQQLDVEDTAQLLLAPQRYFVRVQDVNLVEAMQPRTADVLRFFERLGPQAVDLRQGSVDLDLLYRAPLKVLITGLPEAGCPLQAGGRTLPEVPVLEQGPAPIPLTIEVFEDFGADNLCPVDSGKVTIFDEIADEQNAPATLEIKNGIAQYESVANTPNVAAGRRDERGVDRSYQKALTAIAEVPGQEPVRATEWVVVTGERSRTGTFVSATTQEFPLLILRDPPGDGSFSYLERGTQYCRTISRVFYESISGGSEIEAKAGIQLLKGFGVMTRTTARGIAGFGLEIGVESTLTGEVRLCATTSEQFSTSGSPDFIGGSADVFLGTALNLIFAKADVLTLDGCQIQLGESVRFDADGFETTYLYTHAHIQNTIIPQLEDLAILNPQEAPFYHDAIENWRKQLEVNERLKEEASFITNRSFSAGADYEFSESVESAEIFAYDVKAFTDNELAVGFEFGESGTGVEAKFFVKLGFAYTRAETQEKTFTQTTGYVLTDEDKGDYFSVDVKMDEVFGTPVFELIDGRSSCPWEPGTQPRDRPQLNISPASQLNVPPEKPAVFTLALTNLSDSEETRDYDLRLLQTYNAGGAVLKVGGSDFSKGQTYTIGPNQTQEVTMTVERGPNRFNYDSLAIVMHPPCDPAVADTLFFNVGFRAPCSDITLFRPQSGWTYTKADRDDQENVRIILDGFTIEERDAVLVQSVGAEYRRKGTAEWTPIAEVGAANFNQGESVVVDWDVIGRNIPDGTYEIRAFTRCEAGRNFSLIAEGVIDTAPPIVFGTPQPADGILSFGEDISVTFNEPIRCAVLTPGNTALVYTGTADAIAHQVQCSDRSIILKPADLTEGRDVTATVQGVRDLAGNVQEVPESWQFEVRRSHFTWTQVAQAVDVPYRDPGSISRTLANGTSEAASFEITEHPSWLTPLTMSGTVPPAGTTNVMFAVQEDLQIGEYQGRVRVESNQGDSEFNLFVTVSCHPPVWDLDPAAFEHSMTMVIRVFIDGAASQDPNDRIAAYVGNQLRGTANVEIVPGIGSVAFLTVYSNRSTGETLRFHVYDDEDCRRYRNTVERYSFVADHVRGTPLVPVPLTALDVPPSSVQQIAARQGWTWFSTSVRAADMTVDYILSTLAPQPGDLIKSQTQFAQFDMTAGWAGSLVELNNTSGYMVRLSEAGAMAVEGEAVDPAETPIELKANWNWIGFLPRVSMSLADALTNLDPRADDIIKSQTAFAQYVATGPNRGWFGNLTHLEPGRGYRLFLRQDQKGFTYPPNPPDPDPNLVLSASEIAGDGQEGGTEADTVWAFNPQQYQYNMTVTAVVKMDGVEVAGDHFLLGAFAGEEVRGRARATYLSQLNRYVYFLMVHSDQVADERLSFKVYDTRSSDVMHIGETLAFENDRVVGSISEPHTFLMVATTSAEDAELPAVFALHANYPNPFNPATVIRYDLPRDARVTLELFDLLGRKVATILDDEQRAGYHRVTFNAAHLASGVYIYRLQAGDFTETRRMTLVK